jgi:hypothetical protein
MRSCPRRSRHGSARNTKDDDFSKLLGQHGAPPQVIWVRCGNVRNQELCRIVDAAWARTAKLIAVDRVNPRFIPHYFKESKAGGAAHSSICCGVCVNLPVRQGKPDAIRPALA